jgi:hypothetical protein
MCRMVLKTIEDGIDTRKGSPVSSSAGQEAAVKKTVVEKRPSQGEPSSKPTQPTPSGALRLEKNEIPLPPAQPAPTHRPGKKILPEKPLAPLEPVGVGAGISGKRPPLELHRPDPTRSPRVGQVISPWIEEDKKKGNGRNFLSRMFEKKKTESSTEVEDTSPVKPEEPKEKLRIASCGQPRITASGSVEIPLTLEVNTNGQGTGLSVNLQVAIQLDKFSVQG